MSLTGLGAVVKASRILKKALLTRLESGAITTRSEIVSSNTTNMMEKNNELRSSVPTLVVHNFRLFICVVVILKSHQWKNYVCAL